MTLGVKQQNDDNECTTKGKGRISTEKTTGTNSKEEKKEKKENQGVL